MNDEILVPYEDLVRLHRYAEFSPRSEDDVMARIQGLVRRAEEAEKNLSGHEKLSAALLMLTTQSERSHELLPGRWSNTEDPQEITGGHGAVGEVWQSAHADLIVTLHRTIEAQKDILKTALSQYAGGGDKVSSHDEPGATELALCLAEAILGKTA